MSPKEIKSDIQDEKKYEINAPTIYVKPASNNPMFLNFDSEAKLNIPIPIIVNNPIIT